MKKYVEHGGAQVFRQPFTINDVRFYGFILKADTHALQTNVCDRLFNDPSDGIEDIKPAGPFVLLAFCHLPYLASSDLPDSEKGWFMEQEAAMWVLTVDRKRERLAWAFPYIAVDNSYAMAMGREVYGFPKTIGWFDLPESPEDADHFSVETLVLKTFSPDTEGTRAPIMQVSRKEKRPSGHKGWTSFEEMAKELHDQLSGHPHIGGDLLLAVHTVEDLIRGHIPMIFLKQFRDIQHPDRACFQAVQEVSCKLKKYHGGGLLGGSFAATISDFDSHPIVQDLGLAGTTVDSLLSFQTRFDFTIGRGNELWSAS